MAVAAPAQRPRSEPRATNGRQAIGQRDTLHPQRGHVTIEQPVSKDAHVRRHVAAVCVTLAAAGPGAEVGVTDGPKGVVVNPRNGKAYAAFPDLGVVKILHRDGG